MKPIYLDHNASTPLAPEVVYKMKQVLDTNFGNPSSLHAYGIESKKLVEEAREQVASLINAEPEEIIFTSGGSESNNMAILGIANIYPGSHLVTSAIEHPSVEKVFDKLSNQNFKVTIVSVNNNCVVDINKIEDSIKDSTKLISIMLANNETGVFQPLRKIVDIARENNIIVHTDAAQAIGKIAVDVKDLGVDLMTIAAHKMNGPKGIGALYIRNGVKLPPLILGADHEYGLRAGTENVIEIAGLGEAARIFRLNSSDIIYQQKELRDYFVHILKSNIPKIKINGDTDNKLPNTANIYFPGCDANLVLAHVPEIAASAGAACHANSISPSKVLKAMGYSDERALGSIRFSLGRTTTKRDIDVAAEKIIEAVKRIENKNNHIRTGHLTLDNTALGCSCKLSAGNLATVLEKISKSNIPNTKVLGFDNSDDASVYYLDDKIAILSSIDFFSPVVEDPFDFGRIAAANALSDIYAMGGKPLFANNIVAFPESKLPGDLLVQMIKGAQQITDEAGIPILGGHSIKDDFVKFGMTATGMVKKEKLWKNSGAQRGDKLVLTKRIGTGILCQAAQKKLLNEEQKLNLINTMVQLNKYAAELLENYPVSSCTDVTGFGLLGHLSEMMIASEKSAILINKITPLFEHVKKMVRLGIVAEGTASNLDHFNKNIDWPDEVNPIYQKILYDPQTSGGLLFTINEKDADKLSETQPDLFYIIGNVVEKKEKLIYIR